METTEPRARAAHGAPDAPRVAVATCRQLPEPDVDQELLLDALRTRGLDAQLLAWDDDDADPAGFDACVLRSTWNYHLLPRAFGEWIDRAAGCSRLLNPAPVLHWNLHKRYLEELEQAGLPVVPTAWVSRGETLDVARLAGEHGWDEVVLKPAISGGSHNTRRFAAGDPEADPFLARLTGETDAMIQPFLDSVDREGERALVCIDGEFTHAIRKETRYAGDDESVSAALPLSEEERDIAQRSLAFVQDRFGPEVAADLLYARVDVMLDGRGRWVISELELLEPSLFLLQSPAALERLVEGIARRLGLD